MASKKAESNDLGLGMEEFLAGSPSPEEKEAEVPEEKAAETEPEGEKAEKKEVPEPKEKKEPAPPEKKEEKKPSDEKEADKKASPKKSKEKKPPEKPEKEAKTPAEEPKGEKKAEEKEKPQEKAVLPDWESDTNPYKERFSQVEKRQKDTASWANQVHQQNLALQKQVEIINKKLDGTYDPEKDKPREPSPDDRAFRAEISGRSRASFRAAASQLGEDKVNGYLKTFSEVFGDDPLVNYRVNMADMPVMEAIKAVKTFEFFEKYGNDPDKIVEKIEAELTEKLIPKLREEESKKIMERLSKKEEQPKGFSEVRGESDPPKATPKPSSLGQIFNNF